VRGFSAKKPIYAAAFPPGNDTLTVGRVVAARLLPVARQIDFRPEGFKRSIANSSADFS
jgi:hypothetical protein